MPLWHKGIDAADWVTRFTVGDDPHWDTILLPYDLLATRMHARGLARIGVLDENEIAQLERSLDRLRAQHEDGEVQVTAQDEDCHTLIEQFLTDDLGATGKKVHAGRSRNDQVLAALRLFLRAGLQRAARQVIALAEGLCDLGAAYDDALMPGYTHMQRAMPTTAGLWALGYAELLAGDLHALRHAARAVSVSPLGSAAGYGVPYLDLPRDAVAGALGFRGVQRHVTSVQLSRGKLELQAVHALVQVAATLNRLASDLVLFTTAEYGFVQLPDAFCTGSSIMPQKKNPDVPELMRATYHRLTAEMHLLTSLPANLPSGYHRDLQLTKEAAMRSVLQAHDLLSAATQLVPGITFDRARMAAACTPELFATDHALRRAAEGVPFRDAYRQAAEDADSAPIPEAPLGGYVTPGTPGQGLPDAVREQLDAHRAWSSRIDA